jgi:hypothetical protein
VNKSKVLKVFVFVLAETVAASCAPQLTQEKGATLPAPTGRFSIGRATYHLVDSRRPEPLAHREGARRELMVDVWYPVQSNAKGKAATYIPDSESFEKLLGEAGLKKAFGDDYHVLLLAQTHALEGAPFAESLKKVPVLVFSHGGGVFRSNYTAQIEDLVSHGYVVASIGHTYDTAMTIFPDGRIAPLSTEGAPQGQVEKGIDFRPLPNPSPDAGDAERVRNMDAWRSIYAQDIRFVIDELGSKDGAMSHAPFAAHLDLQHIGALGHSAGGRAAALACQEDSRIKSCLNEDGVVTNEPFYRKADGSTMKQPFLYFSRRRKPPPSDDELKKDNLTRQKYEYIVRTVDSNQDQLLLSTPESFRVLLSTCQVEHFSFTDFPLLQAGADRTKYAYAYLTSKIIRAYTRAFFDKTLKGENTLLDESPPPEWAVSVEQFATGVKQTR